MNMDEIYEQLDSLYGVDQGKALEEFLLTKIEEAVKSSDTIALIQLLNELIGLYRELGEHEKCVIYCMKLMDIVDSSELKGTMAHATTLLNVANCYRSAGLLKESNALYQQVKSYYDATLPADSMLFASLFNNMSLLFQEMGDYESACDCLERALGISLNYPECRIEQATTYANLANTLMQLDRVNEAKDYLEKSIKLFEADKEPDYHYSAALSGLAEICFVNKEYAKAIKYYEKALSHIEKSVGRNRAYEITLYNLNAAKQKITSLKGLDLSERFFNEYGLPMLQTQFAEYQERIAAGLVGEGSECYGYDDELSLDHDFGPGFCLWLNDEDYDLIGEALQNAYDKLPSEYEGIARIDSNKAAKRVGVFRISDFYRRLLGIESAPQSLNDWLFINDEQFAVATNGKVFIDKLGEFTEVRNKIKDYYPREARLRKIARCAALMSQYGQYNYKRMLSRSDFATAQVCLGKFVEQTMSMVYLLNSQYAPFYKWMRKGMDELVILSDIKDDIDFISGKEVANDSVSVIIEEICTKVLDELVRQKLAKPGDNYLDNHTQEIIAAINEDVAMNKADDNIELIDKIVKLEWEAFDKVINEGGRAFCQDDWETFSIMRKSQYMLWDEEMLLSFVDDFEKANAQGWNIITEKYGRMEETTAPKEYEKIKDSLPFISDEKKQIIEAIVEIQVGMMEEFAKEYPKSAMQARSIHTSEDSLFNTSYETYLRGEISTYSDRTLGLYGRFVARLASEGKNIARMTMENTAKMYGYDSIEVLENKLY